MMENIRLVSCWFRVVPSVSDVVVLEVIKLLFFYVQPSIEHKLSLLVEESFND